MSNFNKWQNTAKQAYGGGQYANVETLDQCEDLGDTLFYFIMVELSTADDFHEAWRRINVAQRDLQTVLDSFLSTPEIPTRR